MTNDRRVLSFAGLKFRGISKDLIYPERNEFKFIVTANADFVVLSANNDRFRKLISNNYATIDGQVTLWLAKLLGKPRGLKFEKISGSSFAYDLINCAQQNSYKMFLLGAVPEVNKEAVDKIEVNYKISVKGYSPPICNYPFESDWNDEILFQVSEFAPDILLVAMGTPKQEYWIEENRDALKQMGVKLAIGCGGTLDFIAGRIKRAPLWVQRWGLEGAYRLIKEPKWFRARRLLRSLLIFPIALYRSIISSVEQ